MENSGFNITVINGNNATIHSTSSSSDENKWIINHDNNRTFFISNLTIEGFNTAVENLNGSCVFNNVIFKNNKKNYFFQRDDGGAIINAGLVICNNCTFINNYAKNGGAVFNQGMLILENTTFKDNKGYHKGNDVLNVDQGIVIVNNRMISGSEGNITYVKSISTAVSSIVVSLAVIGTVAIAAAATIITGGLAGLAVGAGAAVGAGVILGGIAAGIITSNQYNLQFNRITTTIEIISTCVAVGLIATGAAYLSYGKKNTEVILTSKDSNGGTVESNDNNLDSFKSEKKMNFHVVTEKINTEVSNELNDYIQTDFTDDFKRQNIKTDVPLTDEHAQVLGDTIDVLLRDTPAKGLSKCKDIFLISVNKIENPKFPVPYDGSFGTMVEVKVYFNQNLKIPYVEFTAALSTPQVSRTQIVPCTLKVNCLVDL